jgi:hypothetical protein
MRTKSFLFAFSLFVFVGCSAEKAQPTPTPEPKPAQHDHKEAPEKSDTNAHAHAQPGDHAHESPHGGLVATANDLHIELKITEDGHIDVFVLDQDTKPISAKGAQGQVKLTLADGIKEFPLSFDEKTDHLTAQSAALKAEKLVALVDLTINGKPYSARFDYSFTPHHH